MTRLLLSVLLSSSWASDTTGIWICKTADTLCVEQHYKSDLRKLEKWLSLPSRVDVSDSTGCTVIPGDSAKIEIGCK